VQPHCLAASAIFLFYIYSWAKKKQKEPEGTRARKKNPQAHAQKRKDPAGARAAFTHRHAQIKMTVITVHKDENKTLKRKFIHALFHSHEFSFFPQENSREWTLSPARAQGPVQRVAGVESKIEKNK
jgi:hypothetical protein